MKTLIFNPFSGASGDMILGSLIGLGADRKKIRELVEAAADVTVSVNSVDKRGITATDVRINVPRETHSRKYTELTDVIKDASLPENIERDALGVFAIMAEAEAKVHGRSLEELHFHEIGQKDALADVIGACAAIHDIDPDTILCTPANTGTGSVYTSHGLMPVPAPATLEILGKGKLLFYGSGGRELLTPTGAALLAYFATPMETLPQGRLLATGYGAGDADTEGPNVLRVMLVETGSGLPKDNIEMLETNVDDVTGEVLGNLFDRLLSLGARDVTVSPATMKKGRPGHIIKAITKEEDSARIAREIMRETGTLGIRVIPVRHRFAARRRKGGVDISLGGQTYPVGVKIAEDMDGTVLHISAEYEDCQAVAGKTGLPLKQVLRIAEEEAWKIFA
jgi:hypothetical protein